MTQNKHDYKAALDGFDNISECSKDEYFKFVFNHHKAIQQALRFTAEAQRIADGGEASPNIRYLVNKAFNLHPEDNRSTDFAIKAMTRQLIKECEDD